MPFTLVFLRPQKLVSTKTLLLKHYYRRQGLPKFRKEKTLLFLVFLACCQEDKGLLAKRKGQARSQP